MFLERWTMEAMVLAWLALIGIFIYGFFKFTWTLRQYNYCIAMIGAAPMPPIEAQRQSRLADALARSITGAALTFNAGCDATTSPLPHWPGSSTRCLCR